MTNPIIKANLRDMLDVLDARAYITIFTKDDILFDGQVFEILSEEKYANYKVIAMRITLGRVSVSIEEEAYV